MTIIFKCTVGRSDIGLQKGVEAEGAKIGYKLFSYEETSTGYTYQRAWVTNLVPQIK